VRVWETARAGSDLTTRLMKRVSTDMVGKTTNTNVPERIEILVFPDAVALQSHGYPRRGTSNEKFCSLGTPHGEHPNFMISITLVLPADLRVTLRGAPELK
jgi:hypothetical protein